MWINFLLFCPCAWDRIFQSCGWVLSPNSQIKILLFCYHRCDQIFMCPVVTNPRIQTGKLETTNVSLWASGIMLWVLFINLETRHNQDDAWVGPKHYVLVFVYQLANKDTSNMTPEWAPSIMSCCLSTNWQIKTQLTRRLSGPQALCLVVCLPTGNWQLAHQT